MEQSTQITKEHQIKKEQEKIGKQQKDLNEYQKQILLLNQLYQLRNLISDVKRTIIIYDIYNDKQQNKMQLSNMLTFARVLMNDSLTVDISCQIIERMVFYEYNITQNKQSPQKFQKRSFKVDSQIESQQNYNNITYFDFEIAEAEKNTITTVRLVVIPIKNNFIDTKSMEKQMQELKIQEKKINNEWSEKKLYGPQLQNARKDWEKIKANKVVQSSKLAKVNHLSIFRMGFFIDIILQKTEQVAFYSLVDISARRLTQISQYQTEFHNIFNIPNQYKPQFLLFNHNPSKAPQVQFIKKSFKPIIFENIKNKFSIQQRQCKILKKSHFYSKDSIGPKISSNMKNSKNRALVQANQEFISNWNKITVDTASCIAPVVDLINQILDGDQSELKKDAKKFNNIFQQYISLQLYLPISKLEDFFTQTRLKKCNVKKKIVKIPSEIQTLTFAHFFQQVQKLFRQEYHRIQTQQKNNQIMLLNIWKKNLKQTYELVNSINNTILMKKQYVNIYHCKDMQKFFNFLYFTLDSIQKIQKITKTQLVTPSSLKTVFDRLRPPNNRLLSYIIDHQKDIKTEQSILYYDLYLLIINQNCNQQIPPDMKYIYNHIHQHKAYATAMQNIEGNDRKLVQAIQSLSFVALEYESLPQNKKQFINIRKIQSKLASLLKIVRQYEFAIRIYFKNKQFQLADNCCRQALLLMFGDKKSQKLIQWGQLFQKDFQFDLALNYFRKAYRYAKSDRQKQNANHHFMDCNKKSRSALTEEETKIHDNFRLDKDLSKFCNEINLDEMYRQLIAKLYWDIDSSCAIVKSKNETKNEGQFSIWIPKEYKPSPPSKLANGGKSQSV